MSLRERDQVLRSVYPEPADDEHFYARALATLAGPRRRLRTVAGVANVMVYGLWLSAGGFVAEQAWDRSQLPFEYRSAIASPPAIHAGEDLRVVVDIVRHRRCTYAITWSVTDSAHMVVNYGPVTERAPGPPGTDSYAHAYPTPAHMAPGPAILRVTLQGRCDDNYLDDWWPRIIDMPAVPFEVLPPTKP